jgi:pyruvate kinase
MKSSNFICTIGPSNNTPERIERMIYKGMSVARLNMSHGTFEEHEKSIENIRIAAERCRKRTNYQVPVAIAIDLCGQEIRIGKIHQQFEKTGRLLKVGDTLKLHNNSQFADEPGLEMIYINYDIIENSLRKKHEIFIGDGTIAMTVEEIHGGIVTGKVTKGGIIKSFQCVFIPEIANELNFPKITDSDKLNIEFGVKNQVDFIFASHVDSSDLIDEVRNCLGDVGKGIEIYAKIQNPAGVDAFDEIITRADGIIFKPTMEFDAKVIPFVQKLVMCRCKASMKPCLIMIDSKLVSTELYNAVNWIVDSGDGTVLTHEAAEGKTKPLESMSILTNIKSHLHEVFNPFDDDEIPFECKDIQGSLASACVSSSLSANASGIIVIGESKQIIHSIHCHKPKCEVIAVIKNHQSARQLNILDRVTPLIFDASSATSRTDFGINYAKKRGIMKNGDTVIVLNVDLNCIQVRYIPYNH